MQPRTEIDRDKLERFLGRVTGGIAAGLNCAISSLGDSLGLYRALRELRMADSAELAAHTGLNERWLREWLRHQACMGQVEHDAESDRFYLSPEAVAVLVDTTHPAYFGGGFESATASFGSLPGLVESFRSGLGFAYDDHGPGCASGIERMTRYFNEFTLVPKVLPLLDGVVDKLERGAAVADVGCGGGVATLAMATAFPRSTFVGYDISDHALARARDRLAHVDAPNLRFVNPREEPMPVEPTFDLVTTFDVIHDAPHPQPLLEAIFRSLRADGTFLCEDIRSFPTFRENLEQHPLAGLLYGFSIMVCMSSALSAPDGAGLGTLGFNESVARDMTAAVGFTRFRRLEFDNPMNNYYEVRK
ncbi:MAG: class I SAM-dependent methyltransferase [Pseudomonadales bacterium]|nr:class I SAM-dependent methyltransferase [Pseudomonadales bacterium]